MKPSEIVNAYLTAYTAGDVDRAVSLVSEDFSFQGPMQAITGRSAFKEIVAHVAANGRGHRVLRQWQDGADVCTLYQFDVRVDNQSTSLLISEWNSVRSGQVASSLMVFDTGRFRGASQASATVVDPVCGMTVEPAAAAARRRYGERDYYFCAETCAEAFDAHPEHYHAAPASP